MLVLALALAGCDTFLGTPEKPPLPGERISILLHQQTLSPDANAEGRKIQLPAPQANESWPQAGGFANHAMHHLQIGQDLKRVWTISVGEETENRCGDAPNQALKCDREGKRLSAPAKVGADRRHIEPEVLAQPERQTKNCRAARQDNNWGAPRS